MIDTFGVNKTLLLGDINLNNTTEQIWSYFNFNSHESEIFICTVPHHGSQYSWEPDVISKCPNALLIVSSGIHSRFKHPHKKL